MTSSYKEKIYKYWILLHGHINIILIGLRFYSIKSHVRGNKISSFEHSLMDVCVRHDEIAPRPVNTKIRQLARVWCRFYFYFVLERRVGRHGAFKKQIILSLRDAYNDIQYTSKVNTHTRLCINYLWRIIRVYDRTRSLHNNQPVETTLWDRGQINGAGYHLRPRWYTTHVLVCVRVCYLHGACTSRGRPRRCG